MQAKPWKLPAALPHRVSSRPWQFNLLRHRLAGSPNRHGERSAPARFSRNRRMHCPTMASTPNGASRSFPSGGTVRRSWARRSFRNRARRRTITRRSLSELQNSAPMSLNLGIGDPFPASRAAWFLAVQLRSGHEGKNLAKVKFQPSEQ